MEGKKEKARTRVRRWIQLIKDSKSIYGSRSWTSTISHPVVSSRALSFHHLEINPQTLTQVSSLAWMDRGDCLMRDTSRMRIKYVAAQSLLIIGISLGIVSL
jgi:hypothetical protein